MSKNVLEIKDTDHELRQPTRRSSRNFNLGIEDSDVSIGIDISKSKIKHGNLYAPSKNIISATSEHSEIVTIAKRKYLENSLDIVEKDSVSLKSTRKSVDATLTKPARKASGLEDSSKSKNMSIGVVSCSGHVVKPLDAEKQAGCTRQSKTMSGSSKATKYKNTSKIEDEIIPKSSRTSIDGPTKATEIQNSSKYKIKDTQKSTRKSINVEVTTASRLAQNGEATSKSAGKSIDDAGHPKSTSKAFTTNANINTKSKSIDASNKTTRKSVESVVVGVAAKRTQKSIHVETSSTSRKLKEVDLFSSPTTRKSTNIENHTRIKSQSKDDTTTLRTSNVETTPRSTSSTSERTKISLDVENLNKLKKKSIDTEVFSKVNRNTIDAELKGKEVNVSASSAVKTSEKSNRTSVDAQVSLKVTGQYIIEKGSKGSAEVTSLTSLKENKNNTPKKSKLKSEHTSPSNIKKRSSDMSKPATVFTGTENDINPNSRRKSKSIVSIEMTPVDAPQKLVRMEIEIPAQSAKTVTADNTTSFTNITQEENPSGSNSGNHKANSSSKIISTPTSEDSNKPQSEADIFVVSIKQEISPKCGVCNQQVEEGQWLDHIAKEHDYLAWREDESPLVSFNV